MASQTTKVEFTDTVATFDYMVRELKADAAATGDMFGKLARYEQMDYTVYTNGLRVHIDRDGERYTVRSRPMNAEDKRQAAVMQLHSIVIDSETNGIRAGWDATRIAAEIRKLAPLGRSERWTQAIESYARFVETDPSLSFAYLQGSVYLAHAMA